MKKACFSSLMFLGLLFSTMSCGQLPLPPLPPPTPTPNMTPTCGFTDLGSVVCGATKSSLTVIRNMASWNAYSGGTTCNFSTTPPIPNFNGQMVLVFSACLGGMDPRTSSSFTSACLYSDHMEVKVQINYQAAIMAPEVLGPCLCQNRAIAVPKTSLPILLTVCRDEYYFNTLTSSGACTTTTY